MEAGAYADSSFLVSLYRADSFHRPALDYLTKHALSLAYTPLHRIEVRNALRTSIAAGHLTKAECAMALRQIEEDLRDGFLIHTPVQWTDIFRRADQLGEKHAVTEPQRAIDLLHVATAVESGTRVFLSFDTRRRKLAKATGLSVRP